MPLSRPLIGITTQTLQAIDGIPEGLPQSVVMNQRYYQAAAMADAAPVLIPLLDDVETLRAIYDRMDGILIPAASTSTPPRSAKRRTRSSGASIRRVTASSSSS
jgi:putative glutamine amidotransferase